MHWMWVLGVGLALSGCLHSGVPIHSAEVEPSCADACILDGREDLSECLRECGGADFTAALGCFDTCYPRPASAQKETSSSGGSFLAELIGAVLDAATSGDDDDAADDDYQEPAGPAPEERPATPSKPAREPTPAKPSKSHAPARPSRG